MSAHDLPPLEFTPAGIPISLRPWFQEYRLEDLEPDKHAFTVIERTLAWGDVRELQWLFARYGSEPLANWVREYGWFFIPRQRFKFWLCFFGIREYRHRERIWPY